ncbi:MAG: SelB C-terminal domain-containing protein, partial [Anaerolineae bacterium]|nr:SelB C-terminal domain-containing protein [Anaerolineae bacterium]
VSARTGEGLPELVAALRQALDSPPPRPDRGRPRLGIDRVFTIAGFGTVVTGTLTDGALRVGQDVTILPQGLAARVRGLQTHRQKVEVALPGGRAAANLVGVQVSDLRRGDVVTSPGCYTPTQRFDAQIRLLPHAPQPLQHNATVDLFAGASQTPARLRLLDVQVLEPGHVAWVQVETRWPIVVAPQDRFIIRLPSPSATLGGGYVVDPSPVARHRRFRAEVIGRLETLAHGTPEEILLQALDRAGPILEQTLLQQMGLPADVTREALGTLKSRGEVLPLVPERPWGALVSRGQWASLTSRLRSLLEAYHAQHPLRTGMPREELKSRLGLEARLYGEVVQRAVAEGVVSATEAVVYLPEHRPRFTPEQERRVEALLGRFRREPYSPPSVSEAEAEVGADVLGALVEEGRLLRLSDSVLFLPETYQHMLSAVIARLRRGEPVTIATVRDLFGTSRKYAQAFLEHLDRERITRRVGDERVLVQP